MKNIWKFTKNTWKNHGNIMEFCHSEKVGTLPKHVWSVQAGGTHPIGMFLFFSPATAGENWPNY